MNLPIFNTPEELNKYLNTFEYGIIINDKPFNNLSMDDNDKYYRFIAPENVFKYKIGTCFDYVEAEKCYFQKYFNYQFNTYFINLINNGCHTILIYKENDKYYYFESSYKKYKGIYEFNSEKEILDFVTNNMIKDLGHSSFVSVYKYNETNNYNCDVDDFMAYIKENSEKIISNKFYNFKRLQSKK